MWICLNNAFLSIVEPSPADENKHPGCLLVRARREYDIENVFGLDTSVEKRPERDYLYRAFIPRELVATQIAMQVCAIDYGNFKNSVKSNTLHHAYSNVWSVMSKLQATPPYWGSSRRNSRQRSF